MTTYTLRWDLMTWSEDADQFTGSSTMAEGGIVKLTAETIEEATRTAVDELMDVDFLGSPSHPAVVSTKPRVYDDLEDEAIGYGRCEFIPRGIWPELEPQHFVSIPWIPRTDTTEHLADRAGASPEGLVPSHSAPTPPTSTMEMGLGTLRPCASCGHENAEHVTWPDGERECGVSYPEGQLCGCEQFTEPIPVTLSALQEAVAQGKAEILEDMIAGTVPNTVATFSELHDFVDANCYAGLTIERGDWANVYANTVQEELDKWLRTRPHDPLPVVLVGLREDDDPYVLSSMPVEVEIIDRPAWDNWESYGLTAEDMIAAIARLSALRGRSRDVDEMLAIEQGHIATVLQDALAKEREEA